MALSVLFVFSVLVGVLNLEKGDGVLALIYFCFLVLMLLIASPLFVHRQTGGWFDPLVFVPVWWFFLQDVAPKTLVYTGGLIEHRIEAVASVSSLNEVVLYAVLLNVVGLAVFFIGCLAGRMLAVPRVLFSPPGGLFLKVFLVFLVSFAATMFLAGKAGSLGDLLLQRGLPSSERISEQTGGHWSFLVELSKWACLVWLAVRPSVFRSPLFWVIFIPSIAMGFVVTGARGKAIIALLMAISIWSISYRRIPYVTIMLAAVLSLLAIGTLGSLRDQTRDVADISHVSVPMNMVSSIKAGYKNWVEYEVYTDGTYGILARVPGEVDVLYGRSYLSALFAPIPSIFLPFEKPDSGGKITAKEVFGAPQTAIPPGVIGEAYLNFHVIGVLMVMLLYGGILGWAAGFVWKNAEQRPLVALYVISIFLFQPHSPSVYDWLHALVPAVLFICIFCGFPKVKISRPAP